MNQSIGKPELLKEINRSLVFDILKSTRSVSRLQLAQKIGLSRATIAILIDELLETGLVQEVGLGNSSGGRPPVILKFNPDAAYALGACMHEYDWSLVVTNLDAKVSRRMNIHIKENKPEAAIEALKEGVERTPDGWMCLFGKWWRKSSI